MKKRHYITAACFSVMSLFTTSCLNLEPQAQMGDNLVWNTADNFQLFANQFYGWTRDIYLSGTATYGNGVSDGPHSDFRSDLLATSSINVYSQEPIPFRVKMKTIPICINAFITPICCWTVPKVSAIRKRLPYPWAKRSSSVLTFILSWCRYGAMRLY